MMASVVGMMRKDLLRGWVGAAGRLQDRWIVYELLERGRLDSMHCARALDQGQDDEMSAFFGQSDRDGKAP